MAIWSVHCSKCRAWARSYDYMEIASGRPVCKDKKECKKRIKDKQEGIKLDGEDKKVRRRRNVKPSNWED